MPVQGAKKEGAAGAGKGFCKGLGNMICNMGEGNFRSLEVYFLLLMTFSWVRSRWVFILRYLQGNPKVQLKWKDIGEERGLDTR